MVPASATPESAKNTAHFQLFSRAVGDGVQWRLLGGNNRDLGRGALAYPDAESCLLAIKQLVHSLPDLIPAIRRTPPNLWVWQLRLDDLVVVASAHSYDRQIRAEHAGKRFLDCAGAASVSDTITMTAARRWHGSTLRQRGQEIR
jgi:hypothetical protein